MFYIKPESAVIEEVIRHNWPTNNTDAIHSEESIWEILNEDNHQDAVSRHWFKQNFINQIQPRQENVTYH